MSEGSVVHAYCLDCDWYATPDDHEYASVAADVEVHATFSDEHTVREGVTEETIQEAKERSLNAATEQ